MNIFKLFEMETIRSNNIGSTIDDAINKLILQLVLTCRAYQTDALRTTQVGGF